MPRNFMGLTKEYSNYANAEVVILPVAFDKAVSWQSGAAKGPSAIIESSQEVELYDIETKSEMYKKGIFTAQPIVEETGVKMLQSVQKKVAKCIKDEKLIVTLGGDHSISLAPVKAHQDFFGDFTVLHLDAHADMRDSYEGNKNSHASVMARVKELGLDIVSVGIRSMEISEVGSLPEGNLFLAEEICRSQNNEKWIDSVISKLKKKVYISLDVDVFDCALMPTTGTPEPGGLGWYHVTELLKKVCEQKELIGFDVVELAPSKHNKAPDFLVAKLIYKILSYKYS